MVVGCDDKGEDATVLVTSVTVSPATLPLTVGGTFTATATVKPSGASKAVTWSSNAEGVATVDNGLITGVTEGSATITATTVDGGYTATVAVKVTPPLVAITGVTATPAATVTSGRTFAAIATVQPDNAANKAVVWSSSDETVATVSDAGVVFGVDMGEAVITVTTVDGGYTAFLPVKVDESDEAKAAKALATALGNATVSGVTVTLTGDVSIADVTVAAGVTLVVPDGKTLTVTGSLILAGTLTVAGALNVTTYSNSGEPLPCRTAARARG